MAAIDRLNGLASETTLAIKAPCAAATTANITLSGIQTIDGVSVGNDSERVLVKDQTDATQNNIYIASSGNWTYAEDAGGNTDWATGTLVYVSGGLTNAGAYQQTGTDSPIVIGTSDLAFTPTVGAGALTRTKLSANLTLYVDSGTLGNDANSGLTSATPFKTIQAAYDHLADTYDVSGYIATIQCAAGTYTSGLLTNKAVIGANGPKSVRLLGGATTSNFVISTTGKDCINLGGAPATGTAAANSFGSTVLTIGGFKLTTSSSGSGIVVSGGGAALVLGDPVSGYKIEFGSCVNDHMIFAHNAWGIVGTDYSISGGAAIHAATESGAVLALHGATVTITGTPAFSTAFAYASTGSKLYMDSMTFNGSASGVRWLALSLGLIYTLNDSATYIPGNTSGAEALGGKIIQASVNQYWGVASGGTGTTLAATGGTSQVLQQTSTGAAITVGRLSLSDISGAPLPEMIGGKALGVNFNSANTDNAITITSPTTNYQVTGVIICNANHTLTTATFGVFGAAAAGAPTIQNAATACTATSNTANTNNNMQAVTPTNSTTLLLNLATIYFRIGTAEGAATTADVYIIIQPLF
jgi:hypothetical protein